MNKIAGYLGGATTLAFQAEALNAAGLQTQALDTVTEVLPILKSEGEQLWEANAHTLNGLLLLECFDDRQSDAESCFQEALDIARSQSAKMWELRAATQLARLWYSQGKSNDAHDSLAPVYDWFTEGFDTADLKIAKELLDALS